MEALEGGGQYPPGWRLRGLNPNAADSIELWLAEMGEDYAEEELFMSPDSMSSCRGK